MAAKTTIANAPAIKTPPSREAPKIRLYALQSALEAAKNTYPREFIGLFRKNEKGELSELVLAPLASYDLSSSSFNEWNLPTDISLTASFHSHPGYSNKPSEQDLAFFGRTYPLHFIAKLPFSLSSVACFDRNGNPLEFKVIS